MILLICKFAVCALRGMQESNLRLRLGLLSLKIAVYTFYKIYFLMFRCATTTLIPHNYERRKPTSKTGDARIKILLDQCYSFIIYRIDSEFKFL